MKVIGVTYGEIAWRQCQRLLSMNSLAMNTYYSQLFASFKALLDDDDRQILEAQIKDIEAWLSDEYNQITLHEAELRMFNNMDLLSGFQVNGVLITQMEIQERLEEVKSWLNGKLYEIMPYIRFTQQLRDI